MSSSRLIDGTAIAKVVLADCQRQIDLLKAAGHTPGLAVVLVGDDPASRAYVRSKDRMCQQLGLHSIKLELPATTSQEELVNTVKALNADPAIHGILVQSPPPRHIDEAAIVLTIDPDKDVDGFHPVNVARLAMGDKMGLCPVRRWVASVCCWKAASKRPARAWWCWDAACSSASRWRCC